MVFIRTSITLAAVFLLVAGPSRAQKDKDDGPKTPNYYPLEAGNSWTYKVSTNGNSRQASLRVTKIEDGKARVEASSNGNTASETLMQTADGVFRYRNGEQEINPPLCLLKFPVREDAKWDGDITVGREIGKFSCEAKEDTVEVPAGKFKAIRVKIRLESQGETLDTTYWFARDVGIVKQTAEAKGLTMMMELQKFEQAKKKEKEKEKK